MLEAVDFMHEKGLCHRDLSLSNILVDDQYNLRIIDFGLSKKLVDLENDTIKNPSIG